MTEEGEDKFCSAVAIDTVHRGRRSMATGIQGYWLGNDAVPMSSSFFAF